MITTFFRSVRVVGAMCGAMFILLAVGCEGYVISDSTKTETVATDSATPTNTTSVAEPVSTVPTSTNTTSGVLNDDPNCALVVKYQNRDIPNEGQVHYVRRVLTSDPFKSANPVCVQYNDTQAGEMTVWKDTSNRGRRVDVLPTDRGIDKIVVWYN
ncbi:MAG: hypothetical protein EPN23_04670 [Verrucomicrobia bacterium]|nr:MAG: hypothetical protein EPN23_04670 [Verrucomicrobiota bacterium]